MLVPYAIAFGAVAAVSVLASAERELAQDIARARHLLPLVKALTWHALDVLKWVKRSELTDARPDCVELMSILATLRSSGEAILHASEHIEAGSGLADAELDWLESTVAELAICAEIQEPYLSGMGPKLRGVAQEQVFNMSTQVLRSSVRAERGLQVLVQLPGGPNRIHHGGALSEDRVI